MIITSSCYKDSDTTEELEVIIEQPKSEADTEMSGQVTDGTDVLSDIDIVVNGNTTAVPNSYFYIQDADFRKQGQLVEAFKDGHLIGMAYPFLIENDINEVVIKRLPELEGKVLSGNVVLSDKISAAIDMSTVVLPSGGTAGQPRTMTTLITDPALLTQMGNSAYSKSGDLLSFFPESGFIMNLEEAGESLELTAYMEVMIDASENGKSLFVYHRGFEYWLEVGEIGAEALLTDQTGYFLIGNAEPGVYMEGQVEQNEMRVSYTRGECQLGNRFYPFISTEKGRWAAVLPEGSQVVSVLYDKCGSTISREEFSSNVGVRDQLIQIAPEQPLFNLVTEVLSCEGNKTEHPSIVLETVTESGLHIFSESAVDILMPACGDEAFSLLAFDQASGEAGPRITWDLDTEDEVGYLSSCDTDEEGYALLYINGEEKYYPYFDVSTGANETVLTAHDGSIRLKFHGVTDRMYAVNEVNLGIYDPEFGSKGYEMNCEHSEQGCGMTQFNVTHYESTGGLLRVTFSGEELWMQTIDDRVAGKYPMEGIIVVKI